MLKGVTIDGLIEEIKSHLSRHRGKKLATKPVQS
jgi:hypothetical protein